MFYLLVSSDTSLPVVLYIGIYQDQKLIIFNKSVYFFFLNDIDIRTQWKLPQSLRQVHYALCNFFFFQLIKTSTRLLVGDHVERLQNHVACQSNNRKARTLLNTCCCCSVFLVFVVFVAFDPWYTYETTMHIKCGWALKATCVEFNLAFLYFKLILLYRYIFGFSIQQYCSSNKQLQSTEYDKK